MQFFVMNPLVVCYDLNAFGVFSATRASPCRFRSARYWRIRTLQIKTFLE